MAVIVLNNGDPQFSIPAGGTGTHKIYGSDGADKLAIATGAKVQLVSGFAQNTDVVYFQGDSTNYTTSLNGSTVTFTDKSGGSIKVAANTTGQSLVFGDGSAILKIDTGTGTITLGSGAVGTTAQTITPTATTVAAPVDTTVQSDSQFGGTTPTPTGTYTVTAAGGVTSVNEGSSLTYTITAATAPTVDTSFTWAINASSTASAGDFTGATSGTAKIIAGQTTATFSVTPLADNVAEFAENFVIDVKNGGTAITSSPITTQINDVTVDNTAPVIAAQTFTYAENKTAGYTVGTVVATDNSGTVSKYEIASGNTSNYFAIGETTGVITLTAAGVAAGAATNDYETAPNTFTLGVKVSDAIGNNSTANVTVNVTNVDDDPPVLSTATGNTSKIVLAYSETLDTASIPSKGDFYVTQTVGASTSVVDVASVTMSGSSIELNLAAGALTTGATVKVSYTPGTKPIQDAMGFDAAVLNNQTVTTDTTAPTKVSTSPVDNATNVAVGDNLVITMSETVKAGTGTIGLYTSAGTLVESFDVAAGTGSLGGTVTFSGAAVTINPKNDLTASTNYYVNVPATAITDTLSNPYTGITNSTDWSFGTPGAGGTTGTTFTLTQGANNFSPTQTGTSQTTAGDDQINGFMEGGLATYAPSLDTINGGDGVDTLTAYALDASDAPSTATSISNVTYVEKFIFRATGNSVFNMASTTPTAGITHLENEGSTAGLAFVNISTVTPTLNVRGATSDTAFLHATGVLSGASDTINIKVDGYNAKGFELSLRDGIETLNIDSSGSASSFNLVQYNEDDNTFNDDAAALSATTMNITGNAALTLGKATLNNVKTLNASTLTGALTADLSTNAVATGTTVTGGTADDSITLLGTSLSKTTGSADSINLGNGTGDTVVIADADSAITAAEYTTLYGVVNSVVSNTEAIGFALQQIGDNVLEVSADLSKFTINNFIFAGGAVGGVGHPGGQDAAHTRASYTLTGLASDDTLRFVAGTTVVNVVGDAFNAAGNNAIELSAATSNTPATIIMGTSTSAGFSIEGGAGVAAAANAGGNAIVSTTGVNKITIQSLGTTTNTIAGGDSGLAGTADGVAFSGVTDIVIAGNQSITLGNTMPTNVLGLGYNNGSAMFSTAAGGSANASTLTGKLTAYGSDSATGDNITGGTNNDSIFGGFGGDSLTGGAGDDSIDGGLGADTIGGGDGTDTLINVSNLVKASAADVITGGVGNDTYVLRGDVASGVPATIYATASRVTDFSISGTNGIDVLQLSALSANYTGAVTGFNSSVAAATAGATVVQTLGAASAGTALSSGADLIQLTSAVTAGATLQAMFDTAIGTSTITGLDDASEIFFSLYDSTNSKMIVGVVDAGNTIIAATDTVTLVGTFDMTAAQYTAFTNTNLSISADDATFGTAAADTPTLTANADIYDGRGGADNIAGLAGADILFGGGGADNFIVATAAASNTTDGIDRILDFTSGTDVLKLAVAAADTLNTGSVNANLSNNSADVASTGTSVATLLANLQTAADALGLNLFDQAGDTFAVKITGNSLAGTDAFYLVQNTGADTNVTAADTIIALIGTSTIAGLTVATVVAA